MLAVSVVSPYFVVCAGKMGKAADGAALLAAAIKAAVSARAPRRTVQAIAAAVTAVVLRPDAPASTVTDTRVSAEVPDAPSVSEEDLALRLRQARAARRRAKRQRRQAAKAAAAMVPPVESQMEIDSCAAVGGDTELSLSAVTTTDWSDGDEARARTTHSSFTSPLASRRDAWQGHDSEN